MKQTLITLAIAYTLLMFSGCIIQPIQEQDKKLSLIGTWCSKSGACYEFDNKYIYSGNDVILRSIKETYTTHNVFNDSYYQDGVIVSDMFKGSFGEVYYNLKENNLLMYLGGVLFNFERQ